MKGKSAGRKPGVPNATPERIEAGLAAWIACGSSKVAARQTGEEDSTIRAWKANHPDVYLRLRHAFEAELAEVRVSRIREIDDAMHAGAMGIAADLREGVLTPKDKAQAVRALEPVASFYDRVGRLDSGRPTEIQETRDTTPDDQLRAEVEAMLKDPKTRAALAGVKP